MRKQTGDYGVVITHREGAMVEVVLPVRCADMNEAQTHADAWTRRHGHGPLDTDTRTGNYAYADRITRPAIRIFRKR